MAPRYLSVAPRRRGIAAAILALLSFFAEQSLLADAIQTTVSSPVGEPFTVGGGAQWVLTGVVLLVSWAFFFAVVRGITLRT